MKNEVNKYLKEIRTLFPIYQKEEKIFFEKLEKQIQLNNDSSYNELVEQFGSPKDIIMDYYNEMDEESLISRMHSKHIKRKIFYILSICIICVSLFACTLLYQSYQNVKNSNIKETETITQILE